MFKSTIQFSTTEIVRLIYYFAFLWLMVYLLFYDTFTFNFESSINQQYFLIFWSPIFAMLLIWLYKYCKRFSYNLGIGLLLILFTGSILCFSYYYSFGNEYFFTISVIAAACYGVFFLNHIMLLQSIVFAFVVLFLLQLYLGLQQQLSFEDNSSFLISGSLQNSGVYAYYLVFNLPFLYWFCFNFSKRFFSPTNRNWVIVVFKLFYAMILAMVFYLIYFTQSRTALICIGVIFVYHLFLNYETKIITVLKTLPKSILSAIGTICIGSMVGVCIWLFNFKKMSAMGRLLILNVAWENITDHFWLGTGVGRFTWYYPQWQAAYFNSHPKPPLAYFLSAGESYIIFNEYLQLLETVGFPGFLLCCYCLYRFFKLRVIKNSNLLSAAKCTVLTILCSGLTSYPFHVNIILLLLSTCLTIGFALDDTKAMIPINKRWLYINKVLITMCLFLVCYAFYKGFLAYNSATQWTALRNKGSFNKLYDYKRLYPILNNDGKFLVEYGEILLADSAHIFNAIYVLEKAKKLSITRQGIEALRTSYVIAKRYEEAIANQQFLVNYLPNKFRPKYNLLQIYALQNDTLNIKKIGTVILKMPKKIPSYEVEQIKQNTRNILKSYYVTDTNGSDNAK